MQRRTNLGLALSGGGFRAALFHLGVLAQMADLGLLRHVEVISTVSGGSIIGALYYLHLKKLLESKEDAAVTDDDYRALVKTIERGFLAGIQKNLRMRTFANPLKNWRMRRPDYSRSDRIGELYDVCFFRPALGTRDWVRMRDLKIIPKGAAPDFHPRRDNAGRAAKVPILLINATSLNTGRNWRFEATRMGEPPRLGQTARRIDKVPRLLRPPGYDALPGRLRDLPLGLAVAASTAVPGLFHPLSISGLYPERRIELVDGGVHDNQGIQGLLDEGCELLVISDASGPLDEERYPGTAVAGVLTRTNGVLMHRLREEQLFRVLDGSRSAGVCFIHMLQGLETQVVPWVGAAETEPEHERVDRRPPGIAREVQRLLAKVRTDLDSFTEIEAYSLSCLGYLLAQNAFRHAPAFARFRARPQSTDWAFLAVRPWLEHPTPEYLAHLEVASQRLFKVFRLAPLLGKAFAVPLLLAAAGLLVWGRGWLLRPHRIEWTWAWWQVFAVIAAAAVPLTARWLRMRRVIVSVYRPWAWLRRLVVNALLPMVLAAFFQLYLVTLDPLFLSLGRLDRLRPPDGTSRGASLGIPGPPRRTVFRLRPGNRVRGRTQG